ncbi:hypothetical protein PG988_000435 [Apiospora saccharicola]
MQKNLSSLPVSNRNPSPSSILYNTILSPIIIIAESGSVTMNHSDAPPSSSGGDPIVFYDIASGPPQAPSLFRNGSMGLYASFNTHMDTVFPMGAALAGEHFPFNPATAEQSKAAFCRRLGVQSWDDLILSKEARAGILSGLQKSLGDVAKYFRFAGDGGPFLGGKEADYADIIIGGWLMMFCETVPEWKEIREWHGGVWGRLHDGLEPYRGTW